MTKQAKYILAGAAAIVVAGGALVFAVVLIIGISIMAAQPDDSATTKGKDKTISNRTKPNKDDAAKSVKNDKRRTLDDAEDVRGTLAPELVGTWERSDGSTQIDGTGKTQYGGGAFYTYEFSADGAVKYTMREKLLTVMQCRITETKDADGKAATSGDTLTIGFGETAHTGTNSCGSDNVDETLPAEIVHLKYELKTEYENTRLCIVESDGEHCYDRKD